MPIMHESAQNRRLWHVDGSRRLAHVKPVTILGLGRMGLPAAEQYVAEGWTVTTWSRSGRSAPGARAATAAVEAVGAVGVERTEAIDVLGRGRLAGVVDGARDRLLGLDRTPAHFTLAALMKDLRLARDSSGVEPAALVRAESAFAAGASADDDITALAR